MLSITYKHRGLVGTVEGYLPIVVNKIGVVLLLVWEEALLGLHVRNRIVRSVHLARIQAGLLFAVLGLL